MHKSVWSDTVEQPNFPKLQGDIKCEVLVIGGGMAGILTAHLLKQRGANVVLVEGNQVGQGVTKNTTAVISAQHDTLYTDLKKKHGLKKTLQYLNANLFAVQQFAKMAQDIDCDFETIPSVIYSKTNKKSMLQEVEFLNRIGYNDAHFVCEIALPFKIAGGVQFDNMAQFHPLKFLYAVAKNLEIYQQTFVTKIVGNTAYTKEHKITASHIVVATHFPFVNKHGFYFAKMHQNRSYVLALKTPQNICGSFTSHDKDNHYFRNYKDLLLVGGIDRRVGKNFCGFDNLRKFTQNHFPQATEKYAFATQDCITLDGVPYIGRYFGKQNWYVATGFNEWGMTSSMISARIISDLVTGGDNNFSAVFSPKRPAVGGQLLTNIGTTLLNFLTPTTKRCSHLGCALKFNRAEKTWECPCHGSRFDSKGKLLDNPAMTDSKV